jgi:hypothetical protein
MKKLIFSTLLASTTLLVLERPVLSNPCPHLDATEITVVDTTAKLRTDPQNDEQTFRDKAGRPLNKENGEKLQAVIYKDNILKVDSSIKPRKVTRSCYYPVILDRETNAENTDLPLFNTSYWISQKDIKNFNRLISSDKTITKLKELKENINVLRAEIQKLQSKNGGSASEIFYFLADLIPFLFIAAITVWFYLQKENFFKVRELIIQLHKQTDELLNLKQSDESAQPNMFITKANPILFDEIDKVDQMSQLNQGNKLTENDLNQFSKHIDTSLKLFMQNLNQGNKLIEYNLSQFYIEINRSLNLFMQDLNQKSERNKKSQEGFSSFQNEVEKSGEIFTDPGINEFNSTTQNQQIKEQRLALPSFTSGEISDKFYSEVISKFNSFDKEWFNHQINSKQFQRVQLTKESAQGSLDSGGTTTKYVEIDEERGTLLIYKAANRGCLIPNPIDPNWERVVSPSCFNVTNKNILVCPAEVKVVSSNVWEVIRKGKFE